MEFLSGMSEMSECMSERLEMSVVWYDVYLRKMGDFRGIKRLFKVKRLPSSCNLVYPEGVRCDSLG